MRVCGDTVEHLDDVVRRGRGRLFEGRGQTEDRPGRRRAHCLVRVFARELGRPPDIGDLGGLLAGECLLQTANDLREDHATVPTRAHQCAIRGGCAHFVDRRLGLARVLHRGTHRVEHVCAGVAVGDGIHVERVYLVRTRLKTRRRGLKRAQQRSAIELPNDGRDCNI